MFGQFESKDERDSFLEEVTKLLLYSKYQNILTDGVERIEAHWFYCYGSMRLTLKVIHKDVSSTGYEVLAQDPVVKEIAKKCFSTEEMLTEVVEVASVPHFEILAGASKLTTMLQEKTV